MRGLRREYDVLAPVDTTPHMRGLLLLPVAGALEFRYNPAYAGTTGRPASPVQQGSIQPRVCGDYDSMAIFYKIVIDTTPRMRGLRRHGHFLQDYSRYNPAYAGTTSREYLTLEPF